jgi:hypothetical protein
MEEKSEREEKEKIREQSKVLGSVSYPLSWSSAFVYF